MVEEIRFEVGGKYENMKGVFEVIAIHRDSMDIRWESGEEISTPIELQQRIIERMAHEKELEEAKALQKAKKGKSGSSKGGKLFVGLEEGDFGATVSKTSWRGRGQLGGAVAQRLKSRQFSFNSWAVLRKPEVIWLDIARQKQESLPLQAKFFARMEGSRICYGVQVPVAEAGEKGDWPSLLAWLEKPENESWLKKQCDAHELLLMDLGKQGFSGTLTTKEEQWVHTQGDENGAAVDSVIAFLAAAGQRGGVDLRIEKQVDKAAAVDKKQDIAGEMAALFESMMPLYSAVVLTSA